MRIYLAAVGCRLNYAEIALLGRQLAAAGHTVVAQPDSADLCVLNSCTVTGEAARQSRQLARRLAHTNPTARLVLTGCYATLDAESAAALPNVALVVGNQAKEDLFALIAALDTAPRARESTKADAPQPDLSAESFESFQQDGGRTRAFVKVQDGCRNHCTFCIVSIARGAERSRSVSEVVTEVNALHAEGYQEAVLTGVHLGGYRDETLATDLAGLVQAILDQTTIPRLRLSSLEPFDLDASFFALWPASHGRLMPHLHLPAQSGSDAVLRRMARRNRVSDFEALVAAARTAIPDLILTTDLIAGFPGESDEDFAATLDLARRIGFGHLHVFPYSSRPGTPAARLPNQLPPHECRRRASLLNALDHELVAAIRARSIGQVRPVLWEAPVSDHLTGAPVPAHGSERVWAGHTDHFLRVLTRAPTSVDLHNRIGPARLIHMDTQGLWANPL